MGPGLPQLFQYTLLRSPWTLQNLPVLESDRVTWATRLSQRLLLTTECETESTKTQCDFTFTYGQNSRHGTLSFYKHGTVIVWCSILSLYFSRTMLKYDQNVPLNKVVCTEATNTLGGSVTSRIQSILIDSGVYEPPRQEDRLYSWMGHHTVYYITQLSTILIDKQLLLLLHPTWQVSAGSLGV